MCKTNFYRVCRTDNAAEKLIAYFRLAASVEFSDAHTGRYFDKLRALYAVWSSGRSLDINQVKYVRLLVNRLYSVNI